MLLKKMHTKIFVIIYLLLSQKVFSQSKVDSLKKTGSIVNLNKTGVNLWGEFGIEREQRIGFKSTLSFFGGILIAREGEKANFTGRFLSAPLAYIEYRNYYSIIKRLQKGKNIENNSANYFLFKASVVFPIKNKTYYNFYIFQGYGLSRSISRKLKYEVAGGINEQIALDDKRRSIQYSPHLGIELFYKLGISYLFN